MRPCRMPETNEGRRRAWEAQGEAPVNDRASVLDGVGEALSGVGETRFCIGEAPKSGAGARSYCRKWVSPICVCVS